MIHVLTAVSEMLEAAVLSAVLILPCHSHMSLVFVLKREVKASQVMMREMNWGGNPCLLQATRGNTKSPAHAVPHVCLCLRAAPR